MNRETKRMQTVGFQFKQVYNGKIYFLNKIVLRIFNEISAVLLALLFIRKNI